MGNAVKPEPKKRIRIHQPIHEARAITYIGKLTVIVSYSSVLAQNVFDEVLSAETKTAGLLAAVYLQVFAVTGSYA